MRSHTVELLLDVLDHRADGSLIITTHVGSETDLDILGNLVLAALALHLAVHFKDLLDTSSANGVTEGDQTTTSVDRVLTIDVGHTVLGKLITLTRLGPANSLILKNLSNVEAIVDFSDINGAASEVRTLKSLLSDESGGLHLGVRTIDGEVISTDGIRDDFNAVGRRLAHLTETLLGSEDKGGTTIRDLRAVGDLEPVGQLRVTEEVGVTIAGSGSLLKSHLDAVHMSQLVEVTVSISLDGNRGDISRGDTVSLAVSLHSASEESREGEVIETTLSGVVGSTSKEVTALTRRNSGLDFSTNSHHDIVAGKDGVDSVSICETTGSTSTFNAVSGNEAEGRVGARNEGTEVTCDGSHEDKER